MKVLFIKFCMATVHVCTPDVALDFIQGVPSRRFSHWLLGNPMEFFKKLYAIILNEITFTFQNLKPGDFVRNIL